MHAKLNEIKNSLTVIRESTDRVDSMLSQALDPRNGDHVSGLILTARIELLRARIELLGVEPSETYHQENDALAALHAADAALSEIGELTSDNGASRLADSMRDMLDVVRDMTWRRRDAAWRDMGRCKSGQEAPTADAKTAEGGEDE